jgi:hypothetical protein
MHEYSSDARDRTKVPFILAAVAVVLAYPVFLAKRRYGIDPPWWLWLEPPSLAAIYVGLHALFDQLVWRVNLLGWRPSRIRDLRGTWVGTLTSSHDRAKEVPVVLWISQTWTRLRIRVETDQSGSHSVAAAVLTDDAVEPGLIYQYVNDPKPLVAKSTMHPHRGTANLRFGPDDAILEGDYYTGRGRENHGVMTLRRVARSDLLKDDARKLAATSLRSTA